MSLKDSLDGCERILRDEFKDYPESALYMIGAIGEARTTADEEPERTPEASSTSRQQAGGDAMNLKILCSPIGVFAEKADVLRDRRRNDRGIFRSPAPPARLRCRPCARDSHLRSERGGTVYVGIDQGVLVKAGAEVIVSVRRAIGGSDFGQLQDAVEREFLKLDEQERNVRTAVAKMESGLIGRLAEFENDR